MVGFSAQRFRGGSVPSQAGLEARGNLYDVAWITAWRPMLCVIPPIHTQITQLVTIPVRPNDSQPLLMPP